MKDRMPNARLVLGITMACALLLIAIAAVYAAAPPNIDTFADPIAAPLLVPSGNTASDSTTSATTDDDILGNERDIYVYNVSAPLGQVVSVDVTGGVFNHSQNSLTTANSVLTYDGSGGGYPSTIYNGLCTPTCIDLTDGGLKNGFRFDVDFDDLEVNVRIKVYDGSGPDRYSEVTLAALFPAGITTPDEVFVEFPTILAGSQGPNGPADFSNVGAIEFEFEGSVQATDFTIEAIDVSIFDWGDLPENSANCSGSTYATTQACQGPRHVVNGTGTLYLGAVVDPSTVEAGEFDGQPTANATGDDANSQDDEDGVVVLQASGAIPPRTWDNGANGGRLEVTVVGDGHLVCWVDFNGNGFETTEAVFNQDVTAGVYDFEFTVPAGTFPPTGTVELYARCRLFPTGEVPVALWPAAWDGRDSLGLFAGTNNRAPGQSKNGEVEDYRWQFSDGALGVALAGLEAQTQSDHVLVSWETVSEVDNLGFNLYRNTSPDGPAEQLNENLIPSQSPGSTQGASYQWQDLDVEAGQTYYYWLEDVDVNGATSMHGPVSVDFQAPTAVSLSRFQAGQTNAPLPGSVPMALLPAATGLALAGAYLLRRRKP